MKEYYLSQMKPGARATVTDLKAEGGMRRRLQDLGLVKGCRVDCVERSPMGDPTAYRICGAVVALRREDADTVCVAGVNAYADT